MNKQYEKLNNNYNTIFQKLHIYTKEMRAKDDVKIEYSMILQEIAKAEKDIKINHET